MVANVNREKAEELLSDMEVTVGQIAPRDGANAPLIAALIQHLNGLRSVLGVERPQH